MKSRIVIAFIALLSIKTYFAQVPKDITVQVKTTVYTSQPKIRFDFSGVTNADSIKIYKKQKSAQTWNLLNTIPATTTFFVDTPYVLGSDTEYRIYKDSVSGSVDGNTYVYTGVEMPLVEYRGKMILIVDSTFVNSLSSEIKTLEKDLIGDGWQIATKYVSRTASVKSVKDTIFNYYRSDTANVKSVLLLGHIPVPYSGNIYPDGHTDHKGAWPADVYYADMDTGAWTDNTVNTTSATRPENDNIPGDGKFDQDSLPGPNNKVELQIGRIDLSNLPKFSQTELQLLSQYLNKNHNYKHKVFNARRRGLIDDRFGWWSGGAFSSCGWRDFSALFGNDSISTGAYFDVLDTADYLWTYACGPGTYTSCGGVGNTDSFTVNQPKAVFNMLLGSYYGDWDSQNNFLRAPLASAGWSLASVWSGIPYTHFHHMGMGETVGYCTQVSQNDTGIYVYLFGDTYVHLALMGDPSLRLHTIAPPTNLTLSPNGAAGKIDLSWAASPDAVLGYNIYRLDTTQNKYNRLNTSLVTGLTYSDLTAINGNNYYMVRAVKLENGSGTYYNMSQGVFDTTHFFNTSGIGDNSLLSQIKLYPNPANENLTIELLSLHNSGTSTLIIYDAVGKICFSTNVLLSSATNYINISTENLSPGAYSCMFQDEKNGVISKRFTIVK